MAARGSAIDPVPAGLLPGMNSSGRHLSTAGAAAAGTLVDGATLALAHRHATLGDERDACKVAITCSQSTTSLPVRRGSLRARGAAAEREVLDLAARAPDGWYMLSRIAGNRREADQRAPAALLSGLTCATDMPVVGSSLSLVGQEVTAGPPPGMYPFGQRRLGAC